MGLLNGTANAINSSRDYVSKQLSFEKKVTPKPEADFKTGFIIEEIQSGTFLNSEKVVLLGNTMPFQPFQFGGDQRIVKEYYPGSSEPTVQVLGPTESDLVINGRLKDKNYKDISAKGVSEALQRQLDAIRIRGNLLKLSLGEWTRYGYLTNTEFSLKTIKDIDYKLTFSIVGFNQPLRCRQVKDNKSVPIAANKALIAKLADFQAQVGNVPETVPQSIGDLIRDAVNDVSEVIASVTGFIDNVLNTVDDINQAITRAQGLVKYAQQQLLRYKSRVGAIAITDPFAQGPNQAGTNLNGAYYSRAVSQSFDLMAFLAELRDRLALIIASSPLARTRVKQGDTLQGLAARFYNNSGDWELIYDHNELTTTDLVVGSVIEIPRR